MAMCCAGTKAQNSTIHERFFGISGRQKPATPLPAPQGLADHVVEGKARTHSWRQHFVSRLAITLTSGWIMHRLNSRRTICAGRMDLSIRWRRRALQITARKHRRSRRFRVRRYWIRSRKRRRLGTRSYFKREPTFRPRSIQTNYLRTIR